MRRIFTTAIFCVGLTSCGAQHKDGTCKDYKPAISCPAGSTYECQTSTDGCRQCGCVANDRFDKPAPGYD